MNPKEIIEAIVSFKCAPNERSYITEKANHAYSDMKRFEATIQEKIERKIEKRVNEYNQRDTRYGCLVN